jgi:DNA-binding CsgD family transcriptional regulator
LPFAPGSPGVSTSFDDLLLVLSQSLIESPPWESFLREIENFFDCQNGVLFLRTPTEDDAGLLISQERTISSPSEIVETYKNSPFLNLPEGQTRTLEEVRNDPAMHKEFKGYVDFHKQKATRDILAFNLLDEATNTQFYFRLVRYSHPEIFGEAEKSLLTRLLPHLKAATSLYARLVSQQRQIYISDKTTTTLGYGFIVLKDSPDDSPSHDGKQIMMLNSAAARLAREQRGIAIRQGELACIDSKAETELKQCIEELRKPTHNEESLHFEVACSNDEADKLAFTVRRFEVPAEFREDKDSLVSLVIRDTREKIALSAEALSKLFGFTPAESQLAERLVFGDSLGDAAQHLGRSRSTARAQLSSIFDKTGIHKQHQLISYIMHRVSSYWP